MPSVTRWREAVCYLFFTIRNSHFTKAQDPYLNFVSSEPKGLSSMALVSLQPLMPTTSDLERTSASLAGNNSKQQLYSPFFSCSNE